MRDPVLNEALRRLAAEAATRFRSLVDTGEEVPFDVAQEPGDHVFYRYVPLTARFIREREDEVRSLPSFGPACAAVGAADIAASYLEAHGAQVPEDPEQRSAAMLIEFLVALWHDAAEFSLEKTRLERALAALEAEVRDIAEADVLIAPLVGLQLPVARLDLPSVRIVRADTIEAPLEAMQSEGMHRNAWQPQFLALVEQEEDAAGAAPALRLLRELVTVLRLFKEGGIGLGPYAFAPTGEGTWRRIATGVAAPRMAAYKLTEAELDELKEFAGAAAAAPRASGAVRWAIDRFEMGLERATATDALSDHLLALRALLEGDGSVGASLAVRAATLCAEPEERDEARARIERAFEAERRIMEGESVDAGGEGESMVGVATWIEGALRSVLRDAIRGELGNDVSASADESLIATGLDTGEGSAAYMGGDAEWDVVPEAPVPPEEETEITVSDEREEQMNVWAKAAEEYAWDEQGGRHPAEAEPDGEHSAGVDSPEGGEREELTWREPPEGDWLEEVSSEGTTLEWPAQRDDRERVDSPHVRHLFPVPDETEWDVSELEYSREKARVDL